MKDEANEKQLIDVKATEWVSAVHSVICWPQNLIMYRLKIRKQCTQSVSEFHRSLLFLKEFCYGKVKKRGTERTKCQEKSWKPRYSNCKSSIIPISFIIIIINIVALFTSTTDNSKIVLFTFFVGVKLDFALWICQSTNLKVFLFSFNYNYRAIFKWFIVTKINVIQRCPVPYNGITFSVSNV